MDLITIVARGTDKIVEHIVLLVPDVHSNYAHIDKRRESFAGHEKDIALDVEALSAAGFFFKSEPDRCECFCCGLVISGWKKNDNPWVDHAWYDPTCCFLRKLKGGTFVQTVLKEKKEVPEAVPETPTKCKVCLEGPCNILLLPCRHLCLCGPCKTQIELCPLCRTPALALIRVFHT